MKVVHIAGFWTLACCLVLALGYANSGPNKFEIDASARREAAVELAKRGASALVVNCILNPPLLSYYCIDAMKAEQSVGQKGHP